MQHVESTAEATNSKTKPRQYWLFFGIGALLMGLLAGFALVQLIDAGYTYHGTVIQSPDPAADFTLTGPNGQAIRLSDFRGQAVMLYFGYTFCPDVCPATMVELARAKQLLGKDGDKLQGVMISVDTLRDTPQKLEEYVKHFDSSFIGLTGSEDEIAAATIPFGIYYEKQKGTAATGYLIDHTASVIVIDPQGYLRLLYPFGTSGEGIAEDIRHLIR